MSSTVARSAVPRLTRRATSAPTRRMIGGKLYPAPFGSRFGPPGRSANSGITATVFGGEGFIGRYFVDELGQIGSRVYVPYRGDEMDVRHLKPMFDLGQLGLIPYSPRVKSCIMESMQHSDIVVNLIGKNYETKHLVPTRRADGKISQVNYGLEEVHVGIAELIAECAQETGVQCLMHVSCLAVSAAEVAGEGSELVTESEWTRTKAAGEKAVRSKFPNAIIVRPATVFGHEDRFLNWIGEANSKFPLFPLLNGGSALVQPVFVTDVAQAMRTILFNHKKYAGKTFELAGPAEYTYKEVVEFVSDVSGVKRPFVDFPPELALRLGSLMEFGMNPILTKDNIIRLMEDVHVPENSTALKFADLGIEPLPMDRVAFDFLHRFRPGGHFTMVKGYY